MVNLLMVGETGDWHLLSPITPPGITQSLCGIGVHPEYHLFSVKKTPRPDVTCEKCLKIVELCKQIP